MKISTTNAILFDRFGDEQTFRMIKEAGFASVDYGYFNAAVLDAEDYIEIAKEQRRLLEKYSLECDQTHAPFDFRYGQGMNMDCVTYRRVIRSIEMSKILGASDVVVHSIEVPDGVDQFEYNLEFYRSFIPVCQRLGIRVAIENLFDDAKENGLYKGRFADSEELMALISALDSPCFSICIDIGHATITGRRPEAVLRGIRGDLLSVLHIHDNDCVEDTHVIPYSGNIDWDEVCRALAEMGYRGNINSEVLIDCSRDEDSVQNDLNKIAEVMRSLGEKLNR